MAGFSGYHRRDLEGFKGSPIMVGSFPGGGVLPIMAYTGRLRPKGVPFSGFRYIKGRDFSS